VVLTGWGLDAGGSAGESVDGGTGGSADVGGIGVTPVNPAGGWKGVGRVVLCVGSCSGSSSASLLLMVVTMVLNSLNSIENACLRPS
jgi:hypothetical protein